MIRTQNAPGDQVFLQPSEGTPEFLWTWCRPEYLANLAPTIHERRLDARLAVGAHRKRGPLRLDDDFYRLLAAFRVATKAQAEASVVRLSDGGAAQVIGVRDCLALVAPKPKLLRTRRVTDAEVIRYSLYDGKSRFRWEAPHYEVDTTRKIRREFLREDLFDAIAEAGPVFLDQSSSLFAFVQFVLNYRLDLVLAEIQSLAAEYAVDIVERRDRLAVQSRPGILAPPTLPPQMADALVEIAE